MKKIFFYFVSISVIIFSGILFSNTSLLGLIFIIFIGLYRGSATGSTIGFFLGLTDGIFASSTFGVLSFSYAVVGYVTGRLPGRIDEENPLAQIIIVFIGVIFSKIISIILEMIFTGNKGILGIGWEFIFVIFVPLFFTIFKKWWLLWFEKLTVER
ncbi:MAG: rod shape-determining protein MreD [Elusimicrobia bacterium RIFOXYC2_FULL_34_12]|nr:MAG: rod shape-determining protein MreD [Elusimicrobia bacterium RIFOXYC2_FULL_34_12]OGS38560.1 MAG: rod shape-determining protein MreD [Elusimicrobia bacterium RIFOXYD2_FULL_34_30]